MSEGLCIYGCGEKEFDRKGFVERSRDKKKIGFIKGCEMVKAHKKGLHEIRD